MLSTREGGQSGSILPFKFFSVKINLVVRSVCIICKRNILFTNEENFVSTSLKILFCSIFPSLIPLDWYEELLLYILPYTGGINTANYTFIQHNGMHAILGELSL